MNQKALRNAGRIDAGECLASIRIERGEHHHPTHPHEKNLKNHEKKFATNKKIPTFAIPKQKNTQKFFEVYFWMDTRRLDDEGGSYLMVMTD